VNSEKVTLASVTGVLPANTGVIVNANAGQYEFKPTDKDAEVDGLSGTTGNKYIFEDAYVLGIVVGNGVVSDRLHANAVPGCEGVSLSVDADAVGL
jgi:hypothetical protein